ncbi:hypothetical protein BOTBODRAFT_58830 [Botryobasidium botryosum FD-172 SS1]|uniref:Choline transporter n=1 Tax=Botryobasidium botryosum (strain FD-172 SS1) TaxID=930990 RepID=A0A067M0T9_BOTB1|nr:hypothetical protein BOTBODRAFT_58830 [Botryobasidium botryosum FD-172 SS1]
MSGELATDINAPSSAEKDTFGYKNEMHKGFSMLSLLGLTFAILNSWVAMATSLTIALPSGGPSAILWGDIVAGVGTLALAASLAEICAVYPTAAGQYYWTAVLASPRYSKVLSWICGWFNVAGWVFLVAAGGSLGGTLITSIIALLHDGYVVERWHIFLLYVAYTLGALFLNVFAVRLLPKIDQAALIWSLGGLIVISITLLATASPTFQSGSFVFRGFINTTGWPDGVAWILGLLQPAFGLTAFDACAHIVEEIPDPGLHAPRAMVLAVLIGIGTSFVFLVILLFCMNNLDSVLTSTAGPLLEIFYQATGNKAGAVCLLIIPVVCWAFTTQAILTTASRMVYAFARDGGLPFSRQLAVVNKKYKVPIAALLFCTVWVIIFGCIFLGSPSALNAIISSSVVSLNLSYAMPIVILLLRGRNRLPIGSFALGNVLGYTTNIVGLIYVIGTTIFFLFPPAFPTNATTMNYTVVVFGVIAIISGLTWIIQGRKHYEGPLKGHASSAVESTPVRGDLFPVDKGEEKVKKDDCSSRITVTEHYAA